MLLLAILPLWLCAQTVACCITMSYRVGGAGTGYRVPLFVNMITCMSIIPDSFLKHIEVQNSFSDASRRANYLHPPIEVLLVSPVPSSLYLVQ